MGGREWFPDELCEEAADEIERLRAEVDTLSKVIRRLNGDGVIYFRDEAVRSE